MDKLFYNFKLFVASSMSIFALLNIWVESYRYNCLALVVAFIFLSVISLSFIDLKLAKRECIKRCFFLPNSIFAKILSSKFFLSIFYIITSLLMSISALYGATMYSRLTWFYLLFHVAISTIIYKFLSLKLSSYLKSNYTKLFAREWTINITAIIFIIFFIYISLEGYEPEYLQDSLQATLNSATNSVHSDCNVINYVLKLQKESDSIFWWMVEKGSGIVSNKAIEISIWLSFLLINSLAILGVNRFILEIIYIIDKIFTKRG